MNYCDNFMDDYGYTRTVGIYNFASANYFLSGYYGAVEQYDYH